MKVNLGCGRTPLEGFVNLDMTYTTGVDIVHDLEEDEPLPDAIQGVTEYRMIHVLEHFFDPLHVMSKLYDRAVEGCKLIAHVPFGSSDDAFEDPTHVRQYFPRSWGYFGQPNYWRADYGYRADWQCERVTLVFAKRFQEEQLEASQLFELAMTARNVVAEMRAELIAIKPARAPLRELQEKLNIAIAFSDA